jgi:hypothetical protein
MMGFRSRRERISTKSTVKTTMVWEKSESNDLSNMQVVDSELTESDLQ